jgi:hypothetical protein
MLLDLTKQIQHDIYALKLAFANSPLSEVALQDGMVEARISFSLELSTKQLCCLSAVRLFHGSLSCLTN